MFLAQDINNKKVVVRTGEHRSLNMLYGGYEGKFFKVPKLIFLDKEFTYEIEEYIDGKLLADTIEQPTAKNFLDKKLQEKLIKAHFEFQSVCGPMTLERKWNKREKLDKHFEKSKSLILQRDQVKEIIYGFNYEEFWSARYPAKWKFSIDNLILIPNDKIGMIDLARTGLYFWGYDLGWIFWPLWFQMENKQYKKAKKHFKALRKFFDRAYKFAPDFEKRQKDKFYKKCWLLVFERLVGSFYDIAEKISHAKNVYENEERKKLFLGFLNELMEYTLKKI